MITREELLPQVTRPSGQNTIHGYIPSIGQNSNGNHRKINVRLRCGQGSGLTTVFQHWVNARLQRQNSSNVLVEEITKHPRTQFTLNLHIISKRCIVQCTSTHLPIAEMTFPNLSKIRVPIRDVSRSNR
jgi:hypothetical protein